MQVVLFTAPTIEPISLAELAEHLRIDTDTLAEALTSSVSLAAGSYAISAGGLYTHNGTGVEVIGKRSLVYLRPTDNGVGGTVDVKIQEADALAGPYTDWTGGAFTQVTEANDTTTQEKEYTGTKRYIRTVAKVLVAACSFGTDVIVESPVVAESDLLVDIQVASREHVEDRTRRALLTQTWDFYLDKWPGGKFIKLPFGNLQTVTSVAWKDTAGTETTLVAGTDYLTETNGEGIGRIVLPYGGTWPSGTLYPSNPIKIRYVCGWTTADLVPQRIKSAVKMISTDLYKNREAQATANTMALYEENKTVRNLLASCRLFDEFG